MLGIIINPMSGKRAFRHQRLYLFRLLKEKDIPFEYRVTKYAGHATEIAREMVEKGIRKVLVLGGDGTMSEVVNGLMSANVPDRESIQFGLMPRGTGNDWGRFWGLTRDHHKSLDVFFNHGKAQPIDIGDLIYYRNGEEHHQYFANSVGMGIDAFTVARAHVMKYYLGSHSILYFFALLSAVFRWKAMPLPLRTDDGFSLNENLFTMNIGNGPYSGGGIRQNPEADPRDGIFHAMFVKQPTFSQLCKAIPKLFNGQLTSLPFIYTYTAKEVELLTKEHVGFELDGILLDACGPFKVRLIPHALQMIVPEDMK